MKSSFFLLCLAIFGCFVGLSYQAGEYNRLSSADVKADSNALGALNYGAQIIAAEAIENRRVKDYIYSVSDIISAKVQTVAGRNYQFECQISDAKGGTILEGVYTVYQNLNGRYTLNEYDYQVVQKESFY